MFRKKFQYALNLDEKKQIKTLRAQGVQPSVIAIYDSEHGTTYADKAIAHFMSKGINVVRVSSSEGLSHPIFTSNHFNGIYLPGGHDVLDGDIRTKFEGQLLEIATQKDLPLLGICRGLQAVGYHSGCEVTNLNGAHSTFSINTSTNSGSPVVIQPGSQLYSALQYKFKQTDSKPIEYPVICLHDQHIVGVPKNHVKVTGRTRLDGTIEAVERLTGKYTSFALQHHPEAVICFYKEEKEKLAYQYIESEKYIKLNEGFIADAKKLIEQKSEELSSSMSENRKKELEEEINNLYKDIKGNKESITFFKNFRQEYEKEIAHPKKSIEEQAARAELGLFTKQVKKQFLEQRAQELKPPKQKSSFAIWNRF